MADKTALYPGTFDPITNGHLSLIERGLKVFDRIVVAVARETAKQTFFTLEERVDLARRSLAHEPRVRVEAYTGLTVTYAKELGVCALLRGLRAVSDFEYEFQLSLMNRRFTQELETVFIMTDYRWLYISSTIIKTVAWQGGSVEGLVPEVVRQKLEEKIHRQGELSAPGSFDADQLHDANRC